MITTVLFDLDGTLLPMDNDKFVSGYFGLLAKKLAPYGYDKDELIPGVWKGTAAMVKNNGEKSNCDVFWRTFADALGERVYDSKVVFDEFYENEFNGAKKLCGKSEDASKLVSELKERGFRIALASNPLFPKTAQLARLEWAGIDADCFEYIASYENSAYSKPNPEYYKEIAERLGILPQECIMVGNDADEDAAAEKIGMSVFLITDDLINRSNKDISAYPHGSLNDLSKYLADIT